MGGCMIQAAGQPWQAGCGVDRCFEHD
jgi:hypothetical protein